MSREQLGEELSRLHLLRRRLEIAVSNTEDRIRHVGILQQALDAGLVSDKVVHRYAAVLEGLEARAYEAQQNIALARETAQEIEHKLGQAARSLVEGTVAVRLMDSNISQQLANQFFERIERARAARDELEVFLELLERWNERETFPRLAMESR